MKFKDRIFGQLDENAFNALALDIFNYQYKENNIYRRYVDSLKIVPQTLEHYSRVPFLPVSFFKTQSVVSGVSIPEKVFLSSGTTGTERSRHNILDLGVYDESLIRGFEGFYGPVEDYTFFALTPTPQQNQDSSLIYMINRWIMKSKSKDSGFYLGQEELLSDLLLQHESSGKKALLIGLSYALLDFAEQFPLTLASTIIMETGGMKGKRREMVREELHVNLSERFGCRQIHSEYGMTELLSQAYAKENGYFRTPSWMKVLIRETNDPLSFIPDGKTGGISIIDLANFNSCSFLALQDLGRINNNGTFEVLGRFDFSDLRGCNLMID
jgi:hypothetical protein